MAGQGRKIKIKFRTSAQMVDTYVTELENHDYEHERWKKSFIDHSRTYSYTPFHPCNLMQFNIN